MADDKGYTRLQVIADEEIFEWWKANADDKNRQDKFREAIKIGLKVIENQLGVCDPNKAKVYDALETLLRSGVVSPTMAAPSAADPTTAQGKEPKRLVALRQTLTET